MNDFKTPVELKDDEELILEVRHYFFVFLPHLIISFLIMIIDFFLLYFLFRQGSWGVIIFSVILIICLFYIARIIFFWRKNSFVITNKRIIDFDQQGFFSKKVAEIPFEKIRDVSYNVKGMMQTFFKYGNIQIQLSESDIPLKFYNIKDPEDIKDLLNKLVRKNEISPGAIKKQDREIDDDDNELLQIFSSIKKLDKKDQKKIYFELKKSLFAKKNQEMAKQERKVSTSRFLEDLWKEDSI